jgi:hypothetical protein
VKKSPFDSLPFRQPDAFCFHSINQRHLNLHCGQVELTGCTLIPRLTYRSGTSAANFCFSWPAPSLQFWPPPQEADKVTGVMAPRHQDYSVSLMLHFSAGVLGSLTRGLSCVRLHLRPTLSRVLADGLLLCFFLGYAAYGSSGEYGD